MSTIEKLNDRLNEWETRMEVLLKLFDNIDLSTSDLLEKEFEIELSHFMRIVENRIDVLKFQISRIEEIQSNLNFCFKAWNKGICPKAMTEIQNSKKRFSCFENFSGIEGKMNYESDFRLLSDFAEERRKSRIRTA